MRWKEQATTLSLGNENLVLEGVLHLGSDRAAVVAPPHPLMGGSLDNPVVNEIAYGLFKAGLGSLRFNWRGVGASQGSRTGDPDAAVRDFCGALAHLRASGATVDVAAGYSFGAATAVRAVLAGEPITELVLVAPPVAMISQLPLGSLRLRTHVLVGERDQFAQVDELERLFQAVEGARVEVVRGVDHFFATSGLSEVQDFVGRAVAR
jgi:alpha/beta superfamily hydrolase